MQFTEAVEQYTEYLLKLSYLYVKDRPLAEDIVQEVFVKLYEKHGETIALENVKGYVVQMTVNRCKDYFRSWHYRKIQVSELFMKKEQAAPVNEEWTLMDEVLHLPMKYREVIILYYYDERSINEVAQLLKLPVATVKTRLQRGRRLLKGLLEEGGIYDEQQA